MHGEYKVPDGKLVAVDLDVSDGKLSQMIISGDFFLEPDESLNDIVRALTGLPCTSSVADLAAVQEFSRNNLLYKISNNYTINTTIYQNFETL